MSTLAPALAGKHVVVTGGARGIGAAIVTLAARAGASVDFSFRSSSQQALSLSTSLQAEGADVTPCAVDLRSATALEAWLADVEARRGRIDALVNNAGVALERLLLVTTDEEIAELLAIDLVAPIVASRAVLRGMVRRRAGTILHVGSSAGQRPVRGQSVYAAAKGALEAFTRALAVEIAGRGVRVLCVAPGPVRTDMLAGALALDEAAVHAFGPILEPAQIAGLVVYLLSDAARELTGQTFAADDDVPGYRRA